MMDSLLILVPAALVLGVLALAAFLWALSHGQYDDPEGAADGAAGRLVGGLPQGAGGAQGRAALLDQQHQGAGLRQGGFCDGDIEHGSLPTDDSFRSSTVAAHHSFASGGWPERHGGVRRTDG
jgi:cbb3-type cytochrome oxidase maturation protein